MSVKVTAGSRSRVTLARKAARTRRSAEEKTVARPSARPALTVAPSCPPRPSPSLRVPRSSPVLPFPPSRSSPPFRQPCRCSAPPASRRPSAGRTPRPRPHLPTSRPTSRKPKKARRAHSPPPRRLPAQLATRSPSTRRVSALLSSALELAGRLLPSPRGARASRALADPLADARPITSLPNLPPPPSPHPLQP